MRKALRRVAVAFRARLTRSWWFPRPQPERHRDFDPKANKEYSDTIRRAMFALLSVALFCLITTFGASDAALLEAAPTIKMPFADVPISFAGFFVTAPLLLLGVTLYLHIFLGHWLDLEEARRQSEPAVEGIPTLFYLDSPVPRLLTAFTFYWLTPLVLGVITWKAAARIEWGIPLALVTVVTAGTLAVLEIQRCPGKPKRRWWDLWVPRLVIVAVVALVAFMVQDPAERFRRPPDLFRADLSGRWLAGADLYQADLRYANLTKANLSQANLTKADLQGATLREANLSLSELTNAKLRSANLTKADLQGAILTEADLQGAILTEATAFFADFSYASLAAANLTKAILSGANLTKANLSDASLTEAILEQANLTNARIRSANLRNANLQEANLAHADLESADLEGANLTKADLRAADLKNVNLTNAKLENVRCLTREQIALARATTTTKLPANWPTECR